MRYHVVFFISTKGLYDCRDYRTKKEMNEALDILKARADISTLFWYKISDGLETAIYIKGSPEPKSKSKNCFFWCNFTDTCSCFTDSFSCADCEYYCICNNCYHLDSCSRSCHCLDI